MIAVTEWRLCEIDPGRGLDFLLYSVATRVIVFSLKLSEEERRPDQEGRRDSLAGELQEIGRRE
jgi:hypothetical protein